MIESNEKDQKNIIIIFCILISAITLILIGYNYKYLVPSFHKFLIAQSELEANRVGNFIAISRDVEKIIAQEKSIDAQFKKEMNIMLETLGIEKIKLFSGTGLIVYSTDKKDIGTINKKDYFRDIVSQGKNYTKIVQKGDKTGEGREVVRDVVESYVPLVKDSKFFGAFELYYDVTERTRQFNDLLMISNIILVGLLIFLLLLIGFFVRRMLINLSVKEQLRKKISTFEKLLPICMHCKRIRKQGSDMNAQDSWDKVENYIADRTESEFSHSICPECMQTHYPE